MIDTDIGSDFSDFSSDTNRGMTTIREFYCHISLKPFIGSSFSL